MAARAEFRIETDLPEEEIAIFEAGVKDYRERPETFIALDEFIARKQAKKKVIK
jgi:hypothetical protein